VVELIGAIVGAIVGVGGFIFGIVKWKDAKNERKKARQKETTEQIIVNKIDEAIKPLKKTNEEQNDRIKRLEEKQDDNERDRLRAEIMIMANKLHNGQLITSADYKHIEHVYTKYKSLGGNSYIDGQMEYIREKEKEHTRSLDVTN
jgi:Flp pilus assembly protein TadB